MFDKTKKKLIHFNTSGNIAGDFLASKKKKCAWLRAIIRLCFFFHLIGGVVCAAIGFAFGAEHFFRTAVCVVIDIVIAFFAAGGEMTTKAALVGIDIILACAGTVKGFLSVENERLLYFLFASTAICGAALAAAEMAAAYLRDFLRDFPTEKLKKDDYTFVRSKPVQKSVQASTPKQPEKTDEIVKALPAVAPKISEMRVLAKRLNDILNNVPMREEFISNPRSEIEVSDVQNQSN